MYIPFYSRFTIDTRLKPPHVHEIIAEHVAVATIPLWIPLGDLLMWIFRRHDGEERYQGYLGESWFTLVWHSSWRNGGALGLFGVVQGRFYEHQFGTRVNLAVRPHVTMISIALLGLFLNILALVRLVPELHNTNGIFSAAIILGCFALFWTLAISRHRELARVEREFWTDSFAESKYKAN
jgi:hypothetical protein